ncbi:hypothetical protein HUE88_11440 [Candidatus Sulfurimonas baltica]|uniref:Uncharacterized protein n=2 Tax=Candidatus Sulfurimonas baltica TaxID=2740404 RepID=A0A7S7RM18_9BACT|nr:hypothetical protein HUE88_11440 [Candidatus Sulfurimonas baltica]
MELTGIILFIGSLGLFLRWGYNMFSILKYQRLLKNTKEELMFEYAKGVVLYIVIAISAGMVWG